MKKGISPVVAVVLLIAIAVIAAVGVWYWVGAYTGKPAIGVDTRAMSISECKVNGTDTIVLVRNIGGVTLSTAADVFGPTGNQVGYINITDIPAGDVEYIEVLGLDNLNISLTPGVYRVIDAEYPEYTFTCTA